MKIKKHDSYRVILILEHPSGFEPLIIELQSIALPTWLRMRCLIILSKSVVIGKIRILEKFKKFKIILYAIISL